MNLIPITTPHTTVEKEPAGLKNSYLLLYSNFFLFCLGFDLSVIIGLSTSLVGFIILCFGLCMYIWTGRKYQPQVNDVKVEDNFYETITCTTAF